MIRKSSIQKYLKRIFRMLSWIFVAFLSFLLTLSLLLFIPSVQKLVTNRAAEYVSDKSNMMVGIGSVHIVFPLAIKIGDVFIEDQEYDTLLYCKQIKINTDYIPLIRQKININHLLIDGLVANIYKSRSDSLFNFSPLIDVFGKEKKSNDKSIKSPWNIGIDKFELSNIKADYFNQIDSSGISLDLGNLLIIANSSDILSGKFDLEKVDLQKTSLSIIAHKNTKPEKVANHSPLELSEIPIEVSLNEMTFGDIHFDLNSGHGNLMLFVDLQQAQAKPGSIDLKAFRVEMESLTADQIDVGLQIMPSKSMTTYEAGMNLSAQQSDENKEKVDFTFGDFPWDFFVNHAKITNVSYNMDLDSEDRDTAGMDYWHMRFSDFDLLADSVYFNKDHTGAHLQELRGKEISGAEITHAEGTFSMDNISIRAQEIIISSPESSIAGTASLGYSSLREIGKHVGKLEIISNLQGSIHVNEFSPFTTVLHSYPLLANIGQIDVENFSSYGTLDNLILENCNAGIGVDTRLKANGSIEGLPSADFKINLELDTVLTSKSDLLKFLPDTLFPGQKSLPENIGLSSTLKYEPNSMNFWASLNTEIGDIFAEVQMTGEELSSNFKIQSLDLGQVLQDSIYGEIELEGQFSGVHADGHLNVFQTELDIKSIDFMGYSYNNLHLNVEGKDELITLYSSIDDSVISFVANGEARLGEPSNHYTMDIQVRHADLRGMNIMNEDFVISGNMDIDTDFTSTDDIDGTFLLSDIHLSNADGNYVIDEVKLISDIKKEYTNFNLTSDIFNSSLTGNTKLAELNNVFNNHLNNYFTIPDSLLNEKEYHFDFDLSLKKPDFFTDFLIVGLREFTIDRCHASYDGASDLFEADISVPKLNYENWEFDDLSLLLSSEGDSILSKVELAQFGYDSAYVKNISFISKFAEQRARLLLTINDIRDSLKYRIESNLVHQDSSYQISLNPENLVIDHQLWTVSPDNQIIIKNRDISTHSALLTNGVQKIGLESIDNKLELSFEKFKIQNFSGILEREKTSKIVNGNLDGNISIVNLFGEMSLDSDLIIHDLFFHLDKLGDLKAQINYTSGAAVNYSFDLTNDVNAIKLDGIYEIENNHLEATLKTDIAQAEVYASFAEKHVAGLKGGIVSTIELSGKVSNPRLNGHIKFNDLSIIIEPLNALLTTNGEISVNDNLLEFHNFHFSDSLQNQITVAGSVDARKYTDPELDLKLTSLDFMIVNSKEEKNKPIVGKLFLGMDIGVKGKLSKLIVNSGFTINKNTDIMYVMQGKDLELITDKGIVVFTDFENISDEVLDMDQEQFIADSIISMIQGIDLTVDLKIDSQAQFRIYVDPNSGDITSFKLNGNLQYKYNDVQRGNLVGRLELAEGYYDLSFYGLVKKKFVYDPGSTITWSGNVMDGEINFSARYEVKTNSVGLVSNEISSYERSMYNQRMPYEVILKIDHQISQPSISFGIDLPERYKNDNPTIASKLNILNQPSMESERNKQVFALLVGGTFIPDNPDVNEGSSSSNFATTAARNSINAIMTQQLNNLTSEFIKGIDVDLGVNTFDDYTTGKAQTRTQLDVKVSKNLFNDRVSAEVESHIDLEGTNSNPGSQSTAGMTEFAVSYKLTEAGNYRIKAFRENAWDIFDGEIQNSGIAFIFIKEFDSFRKNKE